MTMLLCGVLVLIFILDSFLLMPKGSNRFSQKHLLDGEKTGWITVHFKLVTSKVMKGQLWRPATSMFLHAGIPHIVINVLALWNMGMILEGIVGSEKMLLLFFLSGLFSAVCMMLLTKIEDGLGASTAIFGLIGVWIILLFNNQEVLFGHMEVLNWVLLIVYAIAANLTDNTTRLEHLTGTIGGLIFGLLLL